VKAVSGPRWVGQGLGREAGDGLDDPMTDQAEQVPLGRAGGIRAKPEQLPLSVERHPGGD